MKRDRERKRGFRSYTLNFSSQKARTTIITMGLSVAVFSIIICVVAIQLIAGGSEKGLAGRILHTISAKTLGHVISQEIPLYASIGPTPTIAESNVTPKGLGNLLLYLFTDIDASNPLTLLGFQVPGMSMADYTLLTPDPKYDTPPADHPHAHDNPPNADPKPREKVEPPPKPSDKPLVYLYNSHNRESFLPELRDLGITLKDRAYHEERNIEKASTWILEELKRQQIPGIQTLEDYWTMGSFNDAYDLSRKTVQNVLKEQKDLKVIFDVHRDSLDRKGTTRTIRSQSYATVYWIVGSNQQNPHAAQNNALALKLNEYMEKMYPDLSRGVWQKKPANYDTRYNQDLSPNMVLIEIGGPENTLEEIKRTSEAVGKVTAAYLKDLAKLDPNVKVDPQDEVKKRP